MKISIVIPTYNRLQQLKRVLDGLEKQTYPRAEFEVIVVSDGSSDGTDSYLQSLKPSYNLRPLFQKNQGAAAARNHGVSRAEGEYVLFLDDDVYPLPALIEEHLRYHEICGRFAVVIGPMLAPPGFGMSPWVHWEATLLAEQYRAMTCGQLVPTARQFYTGNTSIARHHLLESGGFDPSFYRAEDVELAFRLAKTGLKFYFNPLAAGHHYAERSFASWLSIPYAYGRNDVIFSWKRGQSWLLPVVLREYHQRHFLTRSLVSICLLRPQLSRAAVTTFRVAAQLANTLHLNPISSKLCSGMFNLRYYEGLAAELGGRESFFKRVANTRLAVRL